MRGLGSRIAVAMNSRYRLPSSVNHPKKWDSKGIQKRSSITSQYTAGSTKGGYVPKKMEYKGKFSS